MTCLPLVDGFVDDAVRNTVPSVNASVQLVKVKIQFLCNVRQCRIITKVRWQIMYAFNS